ncbi:MAG: PEP/pyruvate-binding domain-containing protein [Ardenticatenaceae bacterium]
MSSEIELSIRFTSDETKPDSPISVSLLRVDTGAMVGPVAFEVPLGEEALDELGWYLERFGKWSVGPDYERAEEMAGKLEAWGRVLLASVMGEGEAEAARLWQQFVDAGGEGKLLTVDAIDPRVLRLPWELLADEEGHVFAQAIGVRRRLREARRASVKPFALPVRVLMVVSRPDDAGFADPRAHALPLLDGLEGLGEEVVVEFLYPPTLKALSTRLRSREKPAVHVVHFDGHAVYDPLLGLGYLLFENEQHEANPVDAHRLGTRLRRRGVPLMVLSACQSATQKEDPSTLVPEPVEGRPFSRVRASQAVPELVEGQGIAGSGHRNPYASVAARLVRAGVGSVLAMTYSMIESAQKFVGAFYGALAEGRTVGEAVDEGRFELLANEGRHTLTRRDDQGNLVEETLRLRDWFLPALYQQNQDPVLFSPHPPAPSPNTPHASGRWRGGDRSPPFVAAYQNVNRHPLHYEFLLAAFPGEFAGMTPDEYTALVSRRATREYLVGGLKSFRNAVGQRVYGFDVYSEPTDDGELLSEEETSALYWRLARTFRRRPLVYSPSRAGAVEMALSWSDPDFPIDFPAPTASPEYEAYTVGQSYGTLRLLTLAELEDAAQEGRLSRQEIVVIDRTPTDLESIVAGIVTGEQQGALSHLSIRTARRGTPNAYIKDSHLALAPYADQLVRLSLTRSGYYVETGVSQADAEAWWAAQRPPTVTVRAPDVTYSALDDLATIAAGDQEGSSGICSDTLFALRSRIGIIPRETRNLWPGCPLRPREIPRFLGMTHLSSAVGNKLRSKFLKSHQGGSATTRVGGKAANLARLYRFLPSEHQVAGFGIPFGAYDRFMRENTLLDERVTPAVRRTYAEYVALLHQDPAFRTDPERRSDLLDDLRDEMRDNGLVSPQLVAEVAARVDEIFGDGVMVRFRSSSNAEDRLEFNGAGLYDSTSVCVRDSFDSDSSGPSRCDANQSKERTIERGLKKVWASLWNFRAWEERDYYGIDHLDVGMALLITPAFPNERANGVAFTGDPTGAESREYLVNVQDGDVSVVLPDPGVVPERDQLVVNDGQITGIRRLRPSSLLPSGTWVMSEAELFSLGNVLLLADQQFPLRLGAYAREDVLLDLEFKIQRGDNALLIKQIRPFLKNGPHLPGQSAFLRLHVPQALAMCGGWREGLDLRREREEKTRLTLPASDIQLPLEATHARHALFGDLAFGPNLEGTSPTGEGTVQIEPIGDGSTLRVPLAQQYTLGERAIEVTLALSNIRAGEFDLRRLDTSTLTSQLLMTGQIRDVASAEILSRLRLVPCDLTSLPLVRFDIQLEGDRHLILHQRREREDGVSGLAALVSAEIAMPEGTQTINSYRNLTYAADRHHWNEKFEVRFEPPLGDAHAIAIHQHYTGSGDPQYTAELLDQSLNTLRPLTVESVKRGTEGN